MRAPSSGRQRMEVPPPPTRASRSKIAGMSKNITWSGVVTKSCIITDRPMGISVLRVSSPVGAITW